MRFGVRLPAFGPQREASDLCRSSYVAHVDKPRPRREDIESLFDVADHFAQLQRRPRRKRHRLTEAERLRRSDTKPRHLIGGFFVFNRKVRLERRVFWRNSGAILETNRCGCGSFSKVIFDISAHLFRLSLGARVARSRQAQNHGKIPAFLATNLLTGNWASTIAKHVKGKGPRRSNGRSPQRQSR